MKMREALVLAVLLLVSSFAFDRNQAVTFARLPADRANPEGLAVDSRNGDVYAADFEVRRNPPGGGPAKIWKQDPLLTTTGVPPFGANGMAFNKARTLLFVANTGNDTIVQIVNGGATGGAATVLTNSINGADGLIVDEQDNILVCANAREAAATGESTGRSA